MNSTHLISKRFSKKEKKIVFQISFIIFVRMAALFFPLPIFSPLASKLDGATPLLVGLAIGIYPLMQACLQIPLGWLSDKVGRKKIIVVGLLVFLIGSIACSFAGNINELIVARFIQGLGAVSSTLSALIADQTRENQRAKAMGIVGGSVALAFFISTITSPFIADFFGLSQVFWLISLLALIAFLISFSLPQSFEQKSAIKQLDKQLAKQLANQASKSNTSNSGFKSIYKLIYLDTSIFLGHFILSANFFILPIILIHNFQLPLVEHWKVYLFSLIFSLPAMLLTVYLVDKAQKASKAFFLSWVFLVVSQLFFIFQSSLAVLVFALLLFFCGFGSLETILPSLASKQTNIKNKGLVMGFFSSSQQLGSAFGAMFAGFIGFSNQETIFSFNLILLMIWGLFNLKICPQFNLSNRRIES